MPASTTVRIAIRGTPEWSEGLAHLARQRGLSTPAEYLAQLAHDDAKATGYPLAPRLSTQSQGGRPRKARPDKVIRPRGRPKKKSVEK